ncbi:MULTISPECIES: hypothetical protein [unclassified Nodularia (in: cyanobacteria)]|uniref:hypothetical protein n=1 Tax=unclassified Nodularia (in: cyanobacteria) TaxID=2656917 RepID=UPI00187EA523|nr:MULTISPECIES: hypothetical protein [unclassified Nodularia (in: cyanobacteria)]MBE9199725.1 hypothetical protein [Nodularia sp. LEGE 06071]MCC2693373.1 hypothetical protein [Nodularia sp. LEGE 04288]
MHLSFLIPLCTGLACGYVSKKCHGEIAYLISLFTILSLILSLVLAPWQFQLVLLIVVLVSTDRFLLRH